MRRRYHKCKNTPLTVFEDCAIEFFYQRTNWTELAISWREYGSDHNIIGSAIRLSISCVNMALDPAEDVSPTGGGVHLALTSSSTKRRKAALATLNEALRTSGLRRLPLVLIR